MLSNKKSLKLFFISALFFVAAITIILLIYNNNTSNHSNHKNKEEHKKLTDLLNKLDKQPSLEYRQSEKLGKDALKIAFALNDSLLIAKTYYELASIFQKTERADSALIYYKKSQKILESFPNDTLLGKVHNGIANFYLRNEDYNEATLELTTALKKAEKVNDKNTIGHIYNGLGIVYVSTKEFDKALEYFSRARDICSEIGDKKNEIGIYFNIANCYAEKKDYVQALKNYEYLLENFIELKDTAQIINTLSNMGIVSREMGMYNEALSYFDTASKYFDSYNNPSLLSSLKVEMGIYYYANHQYELSANYLKEGMALAKGTYARTNRQLALQYLSLLEEKRGNPSDALAYHKLYTATKDSIMNSEIQKRITDIQWKYDFQKKENEHNLLQKKYEIQKNQNTFLVILSILLLVIAFLIVYMIRLSNKNLKNSMKLKELENVQLQNKIEAEEKINSIDKMRLQTEINAKNAELTTTSLQLVQKNEILSNILEKLDDFQKKDKVKQLTIKEIRKIVMDNLNMDKDWERFKEVFEKVHTNFFLNLKNKYPTLTENELRLCSFIKSNLQTKEIAQMLNINPSTVTISRYRIRKKMQLDRNTQLEDILRNI